MRTSRPGVGRCFNNALVNGLCGPSPSVATDPAFAANAISVSVLVTSILASPWPTARVATERRIFFTKGLSRQASRITSRRRLAGSTAARKRSSGTVSSSTSKSRSSLASVGTR